MGHQEALDGVASFEMDLKPHLARNILKTFTKPFGLWDYHVNVPVAVALGICWMVVVVNLGLVKAVSIVAISVKSV